MGYIAYLAYGDSVSWKTWDGRNIRPWKGWEDLGDEMHAAWENVAQAVLAHERTRYEMGK